MSHFTPVSALLGGVLIGAAASLLYLWHGRIAGISGILDAALTEPQTNLRWRTPFLVGLVVTGLVASRFVPSSVGAAVVSGAPLVVAGLLVGFGTRLANGCTSGHGISGLARLSPRSLAATVTFVGVGMLTTFVVLHLRGGA
jgi:uncharacterized membrane protein YedE/YeeE